MTTLQRRSNRKNKEESGERSHALRRLRDVPHCRTQLVIEGQTCWSTCPAVAGDSTCWRLEWKPRSSSRGSSLCRYAAMPNTVGRPSLFQACAEHKKLQSKRGGSLNTGGPKRLPRLPVAPGDLSELIAMTEFLAFSPESLLSVFDD